MSDPVITVDSVINKPRHIPALVQRMIAAIEALPDGQLYDRARLTVAVGTSMDHLKKHVGDIALVKYRFKDGTKVYYGKPSDIEKLRRRVKQ